MTTNITRQRILAFIIDWFMGIGEEKEFNGIWEYDDYYTFR